MNDYPQRLWSFTRKMKGILLGLLKQAAFIPPDFFAAYLYPMKNLLHEMLHVAIIHVLY
ncbi:protein of unknown function [Xenorhabdus doucetiae]|uniref:Uncharacterized protein n=1 Tax=Xenorhabdus doucetiae TaxID=351671 RepID=A0A068QP91_9GAMM|nr:protein of unknown function [Xenorhabdus doucetiae]